MTGLRKKRVSKKRKIAWRKHIDTKDVDNFLEDKRLEERLGVKFAEQANDDLFQIDTLPSTGDEIIEKTRNVKNKKKPLNTPKCFDVIYLQSSAVPDPFIKRNRVRTPDERKRPLVLKIEADRRARGILTAKELGAKRNRAAEAVRRQNRPKRGEFNEDLWGYNDVPEGKNPFGEDGEWLYGTTLQHTLKNTGRLKKRVPETLFKRTSVIPAVEVPHPGMSYNPSYADHQNLLREVAQKEEKLTKEEEHLKRVTTKMFSRVTRTAKDNAWMSEMSEGLPAVDTVTIKDEEESDADSEYKAINSPAVNKKKTIKQRKRQKVLRQELMDRKEARMQKKKTSDMYKLVRIKQQFAATDRKVAELQAKRERLKELKTLEPKQLSKTKFEVPDLDFNLAEDLRGCLRGVHPEGSLLKDRFKSLQKRNVVEPSLKQKPMKKAKGKRYNKKSHRMEWESTELSLLKKVKEKK